MTPTPLTMDTTLTTRKMDTLNMMNILIRTPTMMVTLRVTITTMTLVRQLMKTIMDIMSMTHSVESVHMKVITMVMITATTPVEITIKTTDTTATTTDMIKTIQLITLTLTTGYTTILILMRHSCMTVSTMNILSRTTMKYTAQILHTQPLTVKMAMEIMT